MTSFDPYYTWLGIPPKHQPPNHYRLLGLEMLEDDAEVIQHAADRQMGHVRTMQGGQHAAEAQRLLNEVAAAAGCLLDADSKQVYDGEMMGGLREPQAPWAAQGTPAVATQPGAARPSDSPRAPAVRSAPASAKPPIRSAAARPPAPQAAAPAPVVRLKSHTAGVQGAAVVTSQLNEGTTVGAFRILRKLDASRSGNIYQAKHQESGVNVALKVLSSEATSTPEVAARFARKVRILSNLHHPNLLQIYDSGFFDGRPYLVTEFIDGQNLEQLLGSVGPFPVEHAVNYTMQAAAGLENAHTHGIYHRNVKPANLMINNQTGVVKMIGLGLARMNLDWLETSVYEQLTAAGTTMGTYDYMAPEQSQDATAVDHRSDIYALGCTLYKLLTGSVVYPVKGDMRKVLAHRGEPSPSLSNARSDVPLQLDMVYQKMLAKKRRDRYQSMAEVVQALEPCAAG